MIIQRIRYKKREVSFLDGNKKRWLNIECTNKTKRCIVRTNGRNERASYCTGYKFVSTRMFDPYIAAEKKYKVRIRCYRFNDRRVYEWKCNFSRRSRLFNKRDKMADRWMKRILIYSHRLDLWNTGQVEI